MFLTQRILDIVTGAKDESLGISMAAKQSEIDYLKKQVDLLQEQLKYERIRADGLVDRLLVKDAKVPPVTPEAIAHTDPAVKEHVNKLKEAFDNLGDVGEIPGDGEVRAFEIGGGRAAGRA